MLPTQRRQAILAEVRQARAVSAEDLARRFGVSLETIRRDLRGLRDRGCSSASTAARCRSGPPRATSPPGAPCTRPQAGHRRAGRGLVEPEDTIVIDVGTTALEVARALPELPRPGADQLGARRDGTRRPGGDRDAALRRAGAAGRRGLLRRARRGLLRRVLRGQGVPRLRRRARPGRAHRLLPARGDPRRTIIAHTAATYVLADSSKLGVIAVHRVCALGRVTAVLTDDAENRRRGAGRRRRHAVRAAVAERPLARPPDPKPNPSE